MNSPTASMSPRSPWNCLASSPFSARLYPVLTGSMKTRSVWSSRVWGFSTNRPGGAGGLPWSSNHTRLGPKQPRCSQTEEEPGPPLKLKVTGRVEGSEGFCRE